MNNLSLWFKIINAALSSRSNQEFYDRISSFYNEAFVNHRAHAEIILKILNDIYSDRRQDTLILDLGCGTGMLSTMMDEIGFNVVGLDLSFLSICTLKQNVPGVNVIHADANFLPTPNASFHTVVCLGVWRHFSDLQKVINEVSRVLTHDGAFVVGYFPPAIAGAIHVNENMWGRFQIWLYHKVTCRLGYLDRADFSLEEETEVEARKKFHVVNKVASCFHKHLLFGRYPMTVPRHTM